MSPKYLPKPAGAYVEDAARASRPHSSSEGRPLSSNVHDQGLLTPIDLGDDDRARAARYVREYLDEAGAAEVLAALGLGVEEPQ